MPYYKWPSKHAVLAPPPTVVPDPPPDDPGGGGGTGGVTWQQLPSGAFIGNRRYDALGNTVFQVGSPTNWVNTPLPDNVLIDATSATVVTEVVRQASGFFRPAFATTDWSLPTYTVSGTFPRVPVKIHTQPPPNYQKAHQQILVDPGIPIPPEYVNQNDSDSECIIVCPDLNIAWEFWRLKPLATPEAFSFLMPDGSTWSGTVAHETTNFWQQINLATHPGRSRNSNAGVYPNAPTTSASRAVSENNNMSVAATRLPFSMTTVTEEDFLRGRIDHAINITVAWAMSSPNYWWPASATDGANNVPLREGMRFRLPPGYVIPTTVHPICALVMQGVRDYGLCAMDKTGGSGLEIDGEPNLHNYFAGAAKSTVLNGFPWADLQLLAQGSDAVHNPTS